MKQIFKLSLLLLAILLPGTATAYDFEVDGIYYKLCNNGAQVTYKDYWDNADAYRGNVTIPETVTYNGTTYSVISISGYAFRDCGLTSITIPSSITSIGERAFYGCSSVYITDLAAWCKYHSPVPIGRGRRVTH